MSGGTSYVGGSSMRTTRCSPSSWYRGRSLSRATPPASTLTRCNRVVGTWTDSCWTARPSPPASSDALRPPSDNRYGAVTVSARLVSDVGAVVASKGDSVRRDVNAATVSIANLLSEGEQLGMGPDGQPWG